MSHIRNNALKQKVLSALQAGKRTAKELNVMFFFNDARKVISVLRGEGYRIRDYRNDDGTKTYFLVPDSQLSIFENGGCDVL